MALSYLSSMADEIASAVIGEPIEGVIPPPVSQNRGKGMTFQVVIDTATNRSNVNLGFANADSFIDFITKSLKPVADKFNVRVSAEKLPEEQKPMTATEI
jgi:hypothetical protein